MMTWFMVIAIPVNERQVLAQGANSRPERMPVLVAGDRREATIQGVTYQLYPVSLESGQYIKIEVTQIEMNMYLRLFDPDEVEIAQVDRDWKGINPEVIEAVAEKTGIHTLAVTALDRSDGRVPYELKVVEIRQASSREQGLAGAERKQCQSQSLRRAGEFDDAVRMALESRELRKQFPASTFDEQFDQGDILNHLGNVYREAGRLTEAQTCYEEAREIWEKILPSNHLHLATVLSNLGLNLTGLGDYDLAEDRLRMALSISESRTDPKSTELLATLNNLAIVLQAKKDYASAEKLLRRVVEIFELNRIPTPNRGAANSNLGAVLLALDKDEEAESLLRRALEIYDERKLDDMHPSRGTTYVSLATRYLKAGDYRQAEQCGLKALGIFDKSLNSEHPSRIEALISLSSIYRALGQTGQAVELRNQAIDLREKNLRRNLFIGSDRQKVAMVRAYKAEVNDTLSLQAQYANKDSRALSLAFLTWLRFKGRAVDEISWTLEQSRRVAGPEEAGLLESMAGKLREYSRLVTGAQNDKVRDRLKQLDGDLDRLDVQLSRRNARYKVENRTFDIGAIREAMPSGTALIEYARYSPVDPGTRKVLSERYLAYVLLKNGDMKWVDLGNAVRIDAAVRSFRAAVWKPSLRVDPRRPARELDRLVMEPVRALLGEAKTVFVAPESELNLVPFAALLTERGRYLVEDYQLIYLTSGRDLLRLGGRYETGSEELIFANSRFDAVGAGRGEAVSEARSGRLSSSMAELKFGPLGFAYDEGDSIRSVRKSARVYRDATETEVKSVKRPFLLHIITHGFFLPDNEGGDENMLLRSGIVFAGANQRRSGRDDGILTALEAAAMDLLGTKLVVLSACDTGRGEVRTGEGVYGLRRALILAGAESQVTSLWQVSDSRTKDLMKNYYARLSAGEGRAEALRNVQLGMIGDRALRHPHFWAAFIQTGEWANLGGERR